MKISAVSVSVALALFANPNSCVTAQSTDLSQRATSHAAFRPVAPPATAASSTKKQRPLKVGVFPFYNKLPSNSQCLIAVELDIAKDWHINANPANPDWMKPTVVTLKCKQDVKISKIKYPKHHELQADGSPDPYHVYDGKVIVYCLLDVKDVSAEKSVELEFHVAFQGCNSANCLNPDSIVMKGKLQVAAAGEELKKVNSEKFPKPQKKPKSKDLK